VNGTAAGKAPIVISREDLGPIVRIRFAPAASPVRTDFRGAHPVDALVWGATDLLIEQMKGYGIFELYTRMAASRIAPHDRQPVGPDPRQTGTTPSWSNGNVLPPSGSRRCTIGPWNVGACGSRKREGS
jgi:hypothetical protein